MKLKDLIAQYGEYEVSETKGDWYDACHITLELEKQKPKSVWELKDGDLYVLLSEDGCIETHRADWSVGLTKSRISNGNVFLTINEAEQDLERRQVENLLLKFGGRRWFRRNRYNYYMWLNTYGSLIISSTSTRVQGVIYFDTEEQAQNAIKEIGKDRIVKALFDLYFYHMRQWDVADKYGYTRDGLLKHIRHELRKLV